MRNIFYIILGSLMFGFIIYVGMKAIDRVAVRDCERGITKACEYVKDYQLN